MNSHGLRTIGHRHLCTEAPHQGDEAYLMVVELEDGRFFLEEEFDDWEDVQDVNQHRCWPPGDQTRMFGTEREAMEYAAELICDRFETDRGVWLKAIP